MYLEMYSLLYGHIAVSASEPPFTFDETADDDTIVLYGRRSNLIFPQQRGDRCSGFLCLRAYMHVILSVRLGT